MAITHDRYFLEETCGWVLELERGEGKPFEGNYSGWLQKKAAMLSQQKRQDANLAKTLENELEWMQSNAKARQTKSKARIARYEELLNTPPREALAHSATIYVPPGPRLGTKVIECADLKKGFEGRTLIDGLSFTLPPGGIVGVVGPNGAGKTTLIKMLKGEESPDEGTLELGDSVKMISIEQTREGLTDDNSVFQERYTHVTHTYTRYARYARYMCDMRCTCGGAHRRQVRLLRGFALHQPVPSPDGCPHAAISACRRSLAVSMRSSSARRRSSRAPTSPGLASSRAISRSAWPTCRAGSATACSWRSCCVRAATCS